MRLAVAFAVACLLMSGISSADSGRAEVKRFTNIPAQSLAAALQSLARERDYQVLYRTELVGEVTTEGAVGELTVDEALTRLLSGTGLAFEYMDEKTVRIVRIGQAKVSSLATADEAGMRLAQNVASAETQDSVRERNTKAEESSSKDKIQEIIVTAQKREERLQDVPIAISVMTGQQLDKSTLTDLTETLNRFPGVVATQSAYASPRISIRGAPPADRTGGTMGYYMDSVPFGFARTIVYPEMNVYDLDRIEVLRGPQGTLYGANSMSGVIRLLTKSPDLNSFEAKTRVSGASIKDGGESYRADAAVNLPIVDDRVAIRLVGGYQDLGGWIDKPNDKDANRSDVKTLRAKLKAKPTEALTLDLSAWFSRRHLGMQPLSLDDRTTPVTDKEFVDTDFDTYALTAVYDFGGASLTSATSYIDFLIDSLLSSQGVGATGNGFSHLIAKVFSEEVTLQSTREGPWRWSIGAMYRDAKDLNVLLVNGAQNTDFDDLSKSIAIFGEATRKFRDGQLEATLGLRYFHDKYSTAQSFRAGGLPLLSAGDSNNAVTPRAVLAWHPTDASTIYASYSQGFRSGLTQHPSTLMSPLFAGSGLSSVGPDKLTNYEVGAKATLFDGRLSLDNSVYYMDWKGIKTSFLVPIPSSAQLITALANGPRATGMGVDMSIAFRPVHGLEVGASASWNDLTMAEQVRSGTAVVYNKGDRMTLSPETTANGFVEFSFPLGGLTGSVNGSVNYISHNATVSPGPVVYRSDSITTTSARFTVDSGSSWSASLFGDNLGDSSGMVANTVGIAAWQPRYAPRTVGLQVEYHMGK